MNSGHLTRILHTIGVGDEQPGCKAKPTLPVLASCHAGWKLDKAWLVSPGADDLLDAGELIEAAAPTSQKDFWGGQVLTLETGKPGVESHPAQAVSAD